MLKLTEFKPEKREEAAYVPILDREPLYAALSLTKKDLEKTFFLLSKTFNEIFDDISFEECTHKVLMDSILDCEENFLWFTAFYREVEKAFEFPIPSNLPFKKCPKNHSATKRPVFHRPFKIDRYKGEYKLRYFKNLANQMDPVNAHRVKYILEEHELTDFQGNMFPAWYLLKATPIFEQYNERTNTRVKIDFQNGEFQYYISGASDNWQPIPDVPLEMDHVVSALLFRQYEF